MEATTAAWVIGIIVAGVFSFLGWVLRRKLVKIDDVENRLTRVETKLDVLGDISTTLHMLRTDVEIIKVRLEKERERDRDSIIKP